MTPIRDSEAFAAEIAELRARESHLRRIIDNMLGFVGVLTPSGELVEINRAALVAGGLQASDVLGRKFWDCPWWNHDPEVLRELESAVARAAAGKVVRYDTQIRARDGQLVWLDLLLAPVTDADGRVTHIVQSAVDVNKRVQAQLLLEQSERLNRLILDNIAQIAWVSDVDGKAVWFNQRWFEFTGTNLEEVAGDGWRSVVHPEHRRRVGDSFDRAIAAGEFWEESFPLRANDASYRWFLARVVPARDVSGHILRWFGTKTDITDRMRHEQELERSQAKLKLSIAIAGLALAEVDYRTDRIQLSQEAARLFGLGDEPCEMPRRKLFEMCYPDERDDLIHVYESALLPNGADVIDIKHRIVRPDGTVRWINVRKQVYFYQDQTGREAPHHGLWAILDITEQKRVEADLESARRQADAANRAKSEFLANMSHEIRSPMAAIIGYADLIESDDESTRDKIETIRRNGQFLLSLVNDILDLSKIEAGKMTAVHQRFCPATLVEDVCSLMRVRAEETGIQLGFRFDGPLPDSIVNDPVRLRQILINLVGNAIKFTDEGTVTLAAGFLAATRQIQFQVIDSGIGISPDQIGRLFQPFEQADSSSRRVFGGSGLGLTISHRLAGLLGGEISVRSRLGEGSAFTLTVPSAPQEFDDDAIAAEPPTSEHGDVPASQAADRFEPLDIRVLIVDDRRDLRLLSKRFIERFGGSALIAEDGNQALQIFRREQNAGRRIDVVLMDVQMPKMDGITTTQILRDRGFKNPIVALTANAMQSDRETCLASGFTDFLSKPIDAGKLYLTLRRSTSAD